jgi:hypothetical protein
MSPVPLRPGRRPTAGQRFLVYGLLGWVIDSLYVWLHTGRRRPSSLLNVSVYGLAQPLFEPVHDRMRQRPLALRGAVYGFGILGVEYASGRMLRRLRGSAPWNYGEARLGIGGLVRLDYLPVWATFGLGLERVHDALRHDRGRASAELAESAPGAEDEHLPVATGVVTADQPAPAPPLDR